MRSIARENPMSIGTAKQLSHAILAVALVASFSTVASANDRDGIVRVKSAYPLNETISRIKKDIADKGI
jgi:hypothetical protein